MCDMMCTCRLADCTTLRHTATPGNTANWKVCSATHCNIWQYPATQCNTLQHAATYLPVRGPLLSIQGHLDSFQSHLLRWHRFRGTFFRGIFLSGTFFSSTLISSTFFSNTFFRSTFFTLTRLWGFSCCSVCTWACAYKNVFCTLVSGCRLWWWLALDQFLKTTRTNPREEAGYNPLHELNPIPKRRSNHAVQDVVM